MTIFANFLRSFLLFLFLFTAFPAFAQSMDEQYDEAWTLYQNGSYDKALKQINQLIAKEKKVQYYQVKAYILIKQKKNEEIIKTVNEGLKLDPDNADLTEMRGTTYYFMFKPELAIQDFRRMIELEKYNARYYNNYFKLLNELRYDDELIRSYEKFRQAVESGEEMKDENFLSDSYFYPSLAFGRKNMHKKAVELLDKAISLSPESDMYYNNRGMSYLELGENKKALADLSKAIDLKPENETYYVNRNTAYFRMNDHKSGRNDLLKALSLGTNDAGVYADLAMSYLIDDDYKKAAEFYQAYIQKIPDNPTALGNYASALIELKQYDKAKINLQKAQQLKPDEIDFYVTLLVLAKIQNDESSLTQLKNNFAKTFPERKLDKSLLKNLEKEGYSYSDSAKKTWAEIVK